MALKAYEEIQHGDGTYTYIWAAMTIGDTAIPLKLPNKSDKTYHIYGTGGGGAGLSIRGSCDPRMITDRDNASSFILKDATSGSAITTATMDVGGSVHANPTYVFPSAPVDGSGPAITVAITVAGGK